MNRRPPYPPQYRPDRAGLATGDGHPDFGSGLRDRLAADDEAQRVWGPLQKNDRQDEILPVLEAEF